MEAMCPNQECSATMEKRYLLDHVTNDCDYRRQTCENCREEIAQVAITKHHSECSGVIVQCTLGCGASLYRKDMDKHVTSECPKAIVTCSLQQFGCDFKGTREDLEKHNIDFVEKHLKITAEYNSRTAEKGKELEERIKSLESEKDVVGRQIQESREVLALTKQDFHTLQTKVRVLEKHMEQQKRKISEMQDFQRKDHGKSESHKEMQSQIEEICGLLRNQEKRLDELTVQNEFGAGLRSLNSPSYFNDRRISKIEHMCATSDLSIAEHDLRIQILEATSYDGTYIWKINDWTQRVHDAQIGKTPSVYSPPFYVGRFGYKVCGRLYPCGDGIGKGTHLSMFFVVMKGEYDSLLPWPFRQKVTFKLMDPNRLNDISDCFRPDPNSSSFQKPKSAMNIASGTPKFVSSRTLENYVVENTLFIKISVDRGGLVDL